MPVTRSEEYYLPRGDLFIQVEDTLFKIYRCPLELHSGFFYDMFSTPSSDRQEGTSDEHPLRLPEDLCSAESFTTLCKLICPKEMGVFPPVLIRDFANWEPVLTATKSLQMTGVQNYILAQLQSDKSDIGSKAAKLIGWALNCETALDTLKLECFYALAYRRRPLSDSEIDTLGSKMSAQVMRMRERIRIFVLNSDSAESLIPLMHASAAVACDRKATCRSIIFSQFIHTLARDAPESDTEHEDDSNIFQVSNQGVRGLCKLCYSRPVMHELLVSLREAKLDQEVQRCIPNIPTRE